MTLYTFRLLSEQVQLRYVLARGTLLANRWESTCQGLKLCDDGGRGCGD